MPLWMTLRSWLGVLSREMWPRRQAIEWVVLFIATTAMIIWLGPIRGVALALIAYLVVAISAAIVKAWHPTVISCVGGITLALLSYSSAAAAVIAFTEPTPNDVRAAFCGLLATTVIMAFRVAPASPELGWPGVLTALVTVPTVAALVINTQPVRRVSVTMMSQTAYDSGQVPFPKPIGVDSTLRIERSESAPVFQVAHGGTGSVLVNEGERFVITLSTDIECFSKRLNRIETQGISVDFGNMERTVRSGGVTGTSQHLESSVPPWVSSFKAIVSAGLLPPEESSGTYYLDLVGRAKNYNTQWRTNDVTCTPVTIIPAARQPN